jgi:hypothetical protein
MAAVRTFGLADVDGQEWVGQRRSGARSDCQEADLQVARPAAPAGAGWRSAPLRAPSPGANHAVPPGAAARGRFAQLHRGQCAQRRRVARAAADHHRPAHADAHAPGGAGPGHGPGLPGRVRRRRRGGAHVAAAAGRGHHLSHRLRPPRRAEGVDPGRRDAAPSARSRRRPHPHPESGCRRPCRSSFAQVQVGIRSASNLPVDHAAIAG